MSPWLISSVEFRSPELTQHVSKFIWCRDSSVGGDAWAVGQRYVSLAPLGLMQDYALSPEHLHKGQDFVAAVVVIVQACAAEVGVDAAGIKVPKL